MFTANRKEWNEIYILFKLLSEGKISAGNSKGKASDNVLPIAYIQREEHDGTRKYIVESESIHITGEEIDLQVSREDFTRVADCIYQAIKGTEETEIESPEEVESFIKSIQIIDLEAQTNDRTDLHIAFYSTECPPIGFRIYSRLCRVDPLLDGGRTANMKFEQVGARFSAPTVNNINFYEAHYDSEIINRVNDIERLGGQLKFNDAADKVFRANLQMVDLHFPRLLGEMTRIFHLEGISRITELTETIESRNPLKIKEDLIRKHGFYRFKIKQFLLYLAFGMRPAKIFTGHDSAVGGFILYNTEGDLISYQKPENELFAEYLFNNTRLEKGSIDKDKFGLLYRENGLFFFNLNVKIGFTRK